MGHSGRNDGNENELYPPLPDRYEPAPHQGVVLPAEGQYWGDQVQPAGGQPWGGAQPPALPAQDYQQTAYPAQDYQQTAYPAQDYQQTAYPAQGNPVSAYPVQGNPAAGALPDSDATQFFPPYPGTPAPGMPPVPDAESTQLIQQPLPGEMPPEAMRGGTPPPMPGAAPFGIRPGGPGYPEPDATQYLPPYQEPAPAAYAAPVPADDYDHLYHQPGAVPGRPSYEQSPPAPPARSYTSYDDPPRRGKSRAAVIGVVVGGCVLAGLGLAAGAALSGGEDEEVPLPAESTSPAGDPTTEPEATTEPETEAARQAKALDALLKDSGNSRASVISSVESIKNCQNLDKAATDLRAAAGQRNALVTSLAALKTDRLPQHEALTASLNKAWKASAAADNHYAAWAGQAKNDKKVCKGGNAKSTSQTQAGNVQSGNATTAKKEAVALWNTIAGEHGLTKRNTSQL